MPPGPAKLAVVRSATLTGGERDALPLGADGEAARRIRGTGGIRGILEYAQHHVVGVDARAVVARHAVDFRIGAALSARRYR